ncbi:hypothetical protein A0O28_0094410 [Trichoderma guizhouense]|uniref:FAD-binding domain-containing protein n=1 Tax=Trichoderma guizhouense TaxID=1491466 RepID=A0A1T3CXT8_9HYPO|nr:hypothetical protein A0O28_0094410 [Trichoderma guizhouense]
MKSAIAIIGAGPCGLTLARLLYRKSIPFTVYEKEESAATLVSSGSLDIRKETGQLALREAGLYDIFAQKARWEDDRVTFLDSHGELLHRATGEAEDGQDGLKAGGKPEIDRRSLRDILLESIPQNQIVWSHHLTKLSFDGDNSSPILHFANGNTVGGFSLVVGTDGAWSKITSTKPQYAGSTFIETRIQESGLLHKTLTDKIGHGIALFLAGPSRMIIQRQGDNSYRIYFGITAPEHFVGTSMDLNNPQATRDILLSSFFQGWAEDLKDYIRNAENFRSWPLYQLPAERFGWNSVPGVTLAGDAAHLSVPNGEGVNLAMKDALELVTKIEENGLEHINKAVEEYERDMLKRGKDHIKAGEEMDRLMTHPEGAKAVVKAFAES